MLHKNRKENQSHKPKKKPSRKLLIVIMVGVCLLLMMIGFAWYYYLSHHHVMSEKREVMPPYYLYLVDENGTDRLQLTIGNLHPGETKQIVFGVSNKNPEGGSGDSYTISKNSKFNYELELAYTQNLPITYKVYSLTKAQGSGDDIKTLLTAVSQSAELTDKNNNKMYGDKVLDTVNLGKYDLYNKTSGADFDLATKVENDVVTFDLDYYMIEITWKDDIRFSDYLKETDLVYVIVNAMQLEPEES